MRFSMVLGLLVIPCVLSGQVTLRLEGPTTARANEPIQATLRVVEGNVSALEVKLPDNSILAVSQKNSRCAAQVDGTVKCVVYSLNDDLLQDAIGTVTLAGISSIGSREFNLIEGLGASPDGNSLGVGFSGFTVEIVPNPCDLTGDGAITIEDLDLLVDSILNEEPITWDLNSDGLQNVVDVQILALVSLGNLLCPLP